MKIFLQIFSLSIILSLCSLFFFSCDKESEDNVLPVISYVVTFKDGDKTLSTISVKENEPVVFPLDPSKEGYIFNGWYYGETKIENKKFFPSEDVSLDAKWVALYYNITYNLNGGTIETDNPTTFNIESGLITLNEPTREGYTFLGWFCGEEKVEAINSNIKRDIVLDARWEIINYTIEYDLNGGELTNKETSYNIESEEIIFSEPTKSNSLFLGWALNGNPITSIEKGSIGNKLITAVWYDNVFILEENTIIGVSDKVKEMENIDIAKIVFDKEITEIGDRAFVSLVNLKSIVFGNIIQTIGESAFDNCTSLDTINIGKNLSEIGSLAFDNCFSLANIVVDEDNQSFKAVNNDLYSFDEKELILYALGKVEATFNVPETVEKIHDFAFKNAISLESLFVGSKVKNIGEKFVQNCENLKEIFYNGTKEDWIKINQTDCSEFDCSTSFTIHCVNVDIIYDNGILSFNNLLLADYDFMGNIEIENDLYYTVYCFSEDNVAKIFDNNDVLIEESSWIKIGEDIFISYLFDYYILALIQ